MMRLLIAATLLLTACSTAYGEEFYLQVSTEILENHLVMEFWLYIQNHRTSFY